MVMMTELMTCRNWDCVSAGGEGGLLHELDCATLQGEFVESVVVYSGVMVDSIHLANCSSLEGVVPHHEKHGSHDEL